MCYDAVSNPAIFIPCGHDTCRECFTRITDPANGIRDGNENGSAAKCPNCRAPIDTKRVTDFDAFKKIHMPELLTEEEKAELDQELKQNQDEDDSDEDDDSETESEDDDVDKNGNLKDFVVPDGGDDEDKQKLEKHEEDAETESEPEDERIQVLKDKIHDGLPAKAPKSNGKKPEAKDGTAKGKGKAKAKGKKEPKDPSKRKLKTLNRNKAVTLADLAKLSQRNAKARKTYLRRLRDNYEDSTKIRRTMELLQEVVDDAEGEKILVFSQWTSLLDLLEIPVDQMGWGYRRYDGSMNTKMRGDAVEDFRDPSKNVRIMLVSLKAGNAGLNLNMASQVIILDPFWSK